MLTPIGTARAAGAPWRRARMALPGQQAGLGPSCGGAGREPGLTNEPDGRFSQGLLRAPQVRQDLAQVLGRSAPVLGQLQRAVAGKGQGGLRPFARRCPCPCLLYTSPSPRDRQAGLGPSCGGAGREPGLTDEPDGCYFQRILWALQVLSLIHI